MHVRQKILSCRSKSTVAYIFTNVMSKVVVFMLDIQSTVFTRDLSASDLFGFARAPGDRQGSHAPERGDGPGNQGRPTALAFRAGGIPRPEARGQHAGAPG